MIPPCSQALCSLSWALSELGQTEDCLELLDDIVAEAVSRPTTSASPPSHPQQLSAGHYVMSQSALEGVAAARDALLSFLRGESSPATEEPAVLQKEEQAQKGEAALSPVVVAAAGTSSSHSNESSSSSSWEEMASSLNELIGGAGGRRGSAAAAGVGGQGRGAAMTIDWSVGRPLHPDPEALVQPTQKEASPPNATFSLSDDILSVPGWLLASGGSEEGERSAHASDGTTGSKWTSKHIAMPASAAASLWREAASGLAAAAAAVSGSPELSAAPPLTPFVSGDSDATSKYDLLPSQLVIDVGPR